MQTEREVPTFHNRQFRGEADLPLLTDLNNAVEEADQLGQGTTIDELRRSLESSVRAPETEIRLWEDESGVVVAWGWLRIPRVDIDGGSLGLKVHPAVRRQGLEEQMLAWSIQQLRNSLPDYGVSPDNAVLRTWTVDTNTDQIHLLERHGFAVERTWLRMERALADPIPEPQFPEAFTLRHLTGPHDLAAWVELYNQSFIDHWNHHDLTVEERTQWTTESHYQWDRDLVAVAPDGTLAAFCFCSINPVENQRNARNDGWISKLGTRRGFRNRGLGRAMVLSGLHRLRADGVDTAMLAVDAHSPTGATQLYESVGFRSVIRSMTYQCRL